MTRSEAKEQLSNMDDRKREFVFYIFKSYKKMNTAKDYFLILVCLGAFAIASFTHRTEAVLLLLPYWIVCEFTRRRIDSSVVTSKHMLMEEFSGGCKGNHMNIENDFQSIVHALYDAAYVKKHL